MSKFVPASLRHFPWIIILRRTPLNYNEHWQTLYNAHNKLSSSITSGRRLWEMNFPDNSWTRTQPYSADTSYFGKTRRAERLMLIMFMPSGSERSVQKMMVTFLGKSQIQREKCGLGSTRHTNLVTTEKKIEKERFITSESKYRKCFDSEIFLVLLLLCYLLVRILVIRIFLDFWGLVGQNKLSDSIIFGQKLINQENSRQINQ